MNTARELTGLRDLAGLLLSELLGRDRSPPRPLRSPSPPPLARSPLIVIVLLAIVKKCVKMKYASVIHYLHLIIHYHSINVTLIFCIFHHEHFLTGPCNWWPRPPPISTPFWLKQILFQQTFPLLVRRGHCCHLEVEDKRLGAGGKKQEGIAVA